MELHCDDCDNTFIPSEEHEDVELLVFTYNGNQLMISHPLMCPNCEGCLNLEIVE